MTSRDVLPGRMEDALDGTIRWALRDGTPDAVPASGVWGRISERVAEGAGSNGRAAWWRRFRLSLADLTRGLLDSTLSVPLEYTASYPPLPRYLWETGSLLLFLPHGDLPMRPGPAGSGVVPLLN